MDGRLKGAQEKQKPKQAAYFNGRGLSQTAARAKCNNHPGFQSVSAANWDNSRSDKSKRRAICELITSPCTNAEVKVKLCLMKLRYDLVAKVTPAMALHEALANQHRYKAEPLFSKTGTGSLSSASTSDSAGAVARSMARIRKLTQLAKKNGAKASKASGRSSKH
jgi:hypothetical protein